MAQNCEQAFLDFHRFGSSHRSVFRPIRVDITYPAGFTDDSSIVLKYKVLGMPTSVFIDSQGQIFEKWTGALNQDILIRTTNEILN